MAVIAMRNTGIPGTHQPVSLSELFSTPPPGSGTACLARIAFERGTFAKDGAEISDYPPDDLAAESAGMDGD